MNTLHFIFNLIGYFIAFFCIAFVIVLATNLFKEIDWGFARWWRKVKDTLFKWTIRVATVLFFGSALILGIMALARADENYTDEQIVNAIYHAEGGAKAQFAYGIRSVPYRDIKDARRICYNTVRNNRKRYSQYGYKKYPDFLSFLASRYCPIEAHPLNKNWLRNVQYFLNKEAK